MQFTDDSKRAIATLAYPFEPGACNLARALAYLPPLDGVVGAHGFLVGHVLLTVCVEELRELEERGGNAAYEILRRHLLRTEYTG